MEGLAVARCSACEAAGNGFSRIPPLEPGAWPQWTFAADAAAPDRGRRGAQLLGRAANADEPANPEKVQEKRAPLRTNNKPPQAGSPRHIFWVIPAFQVSYSGHFSPITPRRKFRDWAQGAYDPLGLGVRAVEAGTLEYSSSQGFCEYGMGFGNYMKCLGAMELDADDSSFLGDFVFAVWWRQDPRYFRLGHGGFRRRGLHAISRVFVTYNDAGKTVFSSSGLAGTEIAAMISNLYYPQQDRNVEHTVSRVGIGLADATLHNGAAEFWPDIQRWLHRKF